MSQSDTHTCPQSCICTPLNTVVWAVGDALYLFIKAKQHRSGNRTEIEKGGLGYDMHILRELD